jgi:hypothetical protein
MELAVSPRLRRRDEKLNEQLVPLYDPTRRLFLASQDPIPVDENRQTQEPSCSAQGGSGKSCCRPLGSIRKSGSSKAIRA